MLQTEKIECPYCWETIEVVVDPSESHQEYVEDCFVCCQPIHLIVAFDDEGEVSIQALSEDDDIY